MNKPIYKNYKTGKYYTIAEIEDFDGLTINFDAFCIADDPKNEHHDSFLATVFVKDAVYDSAETKVDKKGRVYKILDVKPVVTKKGFPCFDFK